MVTKVDRVSARFSKAFSAPMEAAEIFEEAQLDPEAAQAIHADPDVVTATSTPDSGHAQIVAGGYRASGRWSLVSGCELAAWMVLLCVVHKDGKPRHTTPLTAAPTTPALQK